MAWLFLSAQQHAMPNATVMAMTLLPTMLLAAHLDARVTAAQTFVATASVKTAAGASITAPVTIVLTRLTSDDEREKAIAALKQGEAAGGKGPDVSELSCVP